MKAVPKKLLLSQVYSFVRKVELDDIGKNKQIKSVDDRQLVMYGFLNVSYMYWSFVGQILLFAGIVFSFSVSDDRGGDIAVFILLLLFILFSFFYTLRKIIISRSYKFKFDRIAGTLTVERGNRHIIKPFEDVWFFEGWYNSNSPGILLIVADVEGKNIAIQRNNVMDWFSLFIWYMDKNRPLPPGTAFDLYREQDYERRRSEGFPAPLYPSAIETSEWEGAESDEKLKRYRKYVATLKKGYQQKYTVNSKNYRR